MQKTVPLDIWPAILSEMSPLTPTDVVRLMVYRQSSLMPIDEAKSRGKPATRRRIEVLNHLSQNPGVISEYRCGDRADKSKIISRLCQTVFNKKPRAVTQNDRKFVARLLR